MNGSLRRKMVIVGIIGAILAVFVLLIVSFLPKKQPALPLPPPLPSVPINPPAPQDGSTPPPPPTLPVR